jgi:hypothetical protein
MRKIHRDQCVVYTVWLAVVLVCCTGATCVPKRQIQELRPVPIFTTPPTIEQLTEVLNRTSQIQSLQSNSVSIRFNNETTLNATVSWLRERNFRMSASIAGFRGLDVGSNQDAFWTTVRMGMTPELFYARHDEFEAQRQRRILPVSPLWLIEALGVVSFDPNMLVQLPVTQADGMLQLTTNVPSPIGNFQRMLVVDPQYGFTRQIFLKDPNNRLVAQAQQSKHEFYSAIQTSLPHQVKIQLDTELDPPIALDVSIGSYLLNGITGDVGSQFNFPSTNGFTPINIAQPLGGSAGAPLQVPPPPMPVPNTPSYRNTQRGVPWEGAVIR